MDVEQIFQIASAIKSRREELATVEGEITSLEQEMQKLVLSNGTVVSKSNRGTDFLDEVVAQRTKKNPQFPALIADAARSMKRGKAHRSKPGESVRERIIGFLNTHTSSLFTPKHLADAVDVANIQTVHASLHEAVKRHEISKITGKQLHTSAYGAKKYDGSKLYTKVFCSLVNKHSDATPFTEIFAAAGGDGITAQAVRAVLAGMLRRNKVKQVGNSSYKLID